MRTPDEDAAPADEAGSRRQDSAGQAVAHDCSTATDDVERAFLEALAEHALTPADPSEIVADGDLHRYRVDGDRPGRRDGWMVLHLDGVPAGAAGSWRTGEHVTWCARREHELTDSERRAMRQRIEAARAERDRQRQQEAARAASRARRIYDAAAAASPDHPYLEAKGIEPPTGVRQMGDRLVVPMHSLPKGAVVGLEFIGPDHSKRFLRGSTKAGSAFPIQSADGDRSRPLVLAEGMATGASIAAATGLQVAIAFDAGNLKRVARAMRGKYPVRDIIIAGDHDQSGAGQTAARQAAQAVAGRVAIPQEPGDWNDVHQAAGFEAVRAAIDDASAPEHPDEPTGNHDDASALQWPEPLDLRALAAIEPTPPPMLIDHWLPAGYATLIAGHGGAGKSQLALHLGTCMSTGRPFGGLAVARRRVLYLSCEDREGVLHWRLSRICSYLDVDMAELSGRLDVLDLVGQDTTLYQRDPMTGIDLTAAYGVLAHRMRQLGTEVLILDGVTDTYAGNENARAEVKRFVNALVGLISPDRGAVILIAHVNKPTASAAATTEGYSGSTGWHNAVRARWYLRPEVDETDEGRESTGDLLLELQKSNLGRSDQMMRAHWDDDHHLFVPVLEVGMSEFDRRAREREERDGIMAALREVVAQGDYCPAATNGRRTAFHVLSACADFPRSLRDGTSGRRRFWRQIEALRRNGEIRESAYRRANRHVTPTLEPASPSDSECADASDPFI